MVRLRRPKGCFLDVQRWQFLGRQSIAMYHRLMSLLGGISFEFGSGPPYLDQRPVSNGSKPPVRFAQMNDWS